MRRIRKAAVALALAASAAKAQQADRATFYLIVGADTLTIERTDRTTTELRFELFDRKSHSRVAFTGKLTPAALVESLSQSIFVNPVDTAPALRIGARFIGDSVG